ncbi:MAG: Gfo/Idh/MocA family oxidoreductase [Kiritimatiellaeota bacterium]|nr:Gfo/Idh/MocA family oxidoreductase [Kiritimatiellota bacterium]
MSSPHDRFSLRRRDVLAATAAAGGIARAVNPAPAVRTSPSGRIRVGLVGVGRMGHVLTDSLLRIEGIQLVAIADIWDYAREYGRKYLKANKIIVNAYENHEDLLAGEKDLQAVIVATPDVWHAPVTNDCLKAGKDVYCEKMMSNTLEAARSMVQTMRATGKLLQIGHQRRSNPRYLFARNRLIREARICGRLTAANAQWNRGVTVDFGWPKKSDMRPEQLARYGYADMHQFRNWRWFHKLGGGPLSDLGAHQIDMFNWFLDARPRSVMAAGGMDYYQTHEWYDNAMVVYEYGLPEGVVRAFYQVQTTTSAGGGYFEYFMGDNGSLKISENPNQTALYREERAPKEYWAELVKKNYLREKKAAPAEATGTKVDVRESKELVGYDIPVSFNKKIHQPHLENFFKAIRGEAKLNCPADEALASEAVIFKANEAIAAKRTLDITKADTEA